MSVFQLFRIGAVSLVIGALMGLIGALIAPGSADLQQELESPLFVPSNLLSLIGGLLTVLGLPAAYARIAGRSGAIGLIGFVGTMLAGILLGFFGPTVTLLIFPWVAAQPIPAAELEQGPPAFGVYFPIAAVIALLGAVLFGIAVIRSKVFAPWPGYLLIVAGVVNLVTGFISLPPGPLESLSSHLFYLALGWLGVELWRSSREPAPAPPQAVP